MREKSLGEEHPSTTDTYHSISLVFEKKGDYDASLLYYSQVFKAYKKEHGSDHSKSIDAKDQVDRVSRLVHGLDCVYVLVFDAEKYSKVVSLVIYCHVVIKVFSILV